MSHHKLCSALVSVVQDKFFIRSVLYKFGAHIISIKYLISKFESTQKDRVSKNQNNLIKIEISIRFPGGLELFYDLVLETIHTLTGK